ncbi:MAG: hypothetical protein KAX44_05175 [Candidatus Brocadiae bacterium]|nr:hypothetical protein [Candidatus Brocadiia bacterium]
MRIRRVDVEGEARGRIDESGLSAATVYRSRRRDVDRLLDMLREEVAHHAEYAATEPRDWGFAGDMGHLRNLLIEALAFLAQQDRDDVERRLESTTEEGR